MAVDLDSLREAIRLHVPGVRTAPGLAHFWDGSVSDAVVPSGFSVRVYGNGAIYTSIKYPMMSPDDRRLMRAIIDELDRQHAEGSNT